MPLPQFNTSPNPARATGSRLESRQLCRTCSNCSTAHRYGLVSGCYLCYLFDSFYKQRPEAKRLHRLKQETA